MKSLVALGLALASFGCDFDPKAVIGNESSGGEAEVEGGGPVYTGSSNCVTELRYVKGNPNPLQGTCAVPNTGHVWDMTADADGKIRFIVGKIEVDTFPEVRDLYYSSPIGRDVMVRFDCVAQEGAQEGKPYLCSPQGAIRLSDVQPRADQAWIEFAQMVMVNPKCGNSTWFVTSDESPWNDCVPRPDAPISMGGPRAPFLWVVE